MQKSLHWIALGVALAAGANSVAIASNVPRYRLRRLPVPLDSRADLSHQAPSSGHRVRFNAVSPAYLPAAQIGTTYHDLQHVASTGRQVDEQGGKVQASWTKAPGPTAAIRTVNWSRATVQGSPQDYTLNDGRVVRYLFLATLMIGQEFTAVRPGFTNLRNRPGGKTVVIYHDAPLMGGIQFNEAQLDLTSASGIFAGMPSTLPSRPCDQHGCDEPIWPKQAISVCGADIVHHTVGTYSGYPEEVWYWRGIINDGAGSISWSSMPGGLPMMIDPMSAGVSSVIETQGDTVYIVMAKTVNSSLNADLVYYRSTNCGIAWGNMVNVTGFTDDDPEGLLSELGAVIDEDGELHVIYNTVPASGADAPVNLYHWSPSTGIRMITAATWSDKCTGLWDPCLMSGMACQAREPVLTEPNLSVKPAGLHGIGEELHFAVWTQFGPSDSDCATINSQGTLGGHLNGEIYMSVSSNGGLTWDRPQNITGSHTPGCLPGDCLSESWVSAAAQADSGLYLSYMEDKHAGAATSGFGEWSEGPYMLLAPETRLPVAEARIAAAPVQFIDLNANPLSGTPQTVEVVIQNIGTASLQFQVVVAPDESGPTYVTVNGGASYSSSIAAGGAPEELQIQFHTLGLPDPSEHNWRLEVTSNDPENDPGQGGAAIDVSLQVFAASVWHACTSDTLSTLMHRLQISSCLELGGQGHTGTGFFNLADSSEWLASGSPVITLNMAGDSLAYDNAFLTPAERTRSANRSFRAQSPLFVARDTVLSTGFTGAEHLMTADLAWGSATTTDSTIGLEYRFVLPRSAALSDGAYLTLAMHNRTGTLITGLSFGAIADFDVTRPSENENDGVASAFNGLVAVRGGEADTSGNFTPNTNYIALFALTPEGGCFHNGQGAGQILDNAFYLQPAGFFIPDSLNALFDEFGSQDTWLSSPHIDTGQEYGDLSAMLVYSHNTQLGVTDTLRWGFGITTSKLSFNDLKLKVNDLRRSANTDSIVACCAIVVPGDLDLSNSVTSADIILSINYCFKGGAPPLPCHINGDVNCTGTVTSADIIYLVGYVFKGGDAPCDICTDSPVPCIP